MQGFHGKDFECVNCKKIIICNKNFGSSHRNHCPFCGYSLHVDVAKGDRASECGGLMEPIGLVYKGHEELCLVHMCQKCGKVNYNRIAGDDKTSTIEDIFEKSLILQEKVRSDIVKEGLELLDENDREDLKTQLYGKSSQL